MTWHTDMSRQQKKDFMKVIAVSISISGAILIILIAVCAWLIGYHTRKSQDNLPSLESITEMDEAGVNDLLIGYRNYQLEDVWGELDIVSDNTWIWEIDEHTQLQVSCNNKEKVVACSLELDSQE